MIGREHHPLLRLGSLTLRVLRHMWKIGGARPVRGTAVRPRPPELLTQFGLAVVRCCGLRRCSAWEPTVWAWVCVDGERGGGNQGVHDACARGWIRLRCKPPPSGVTPPGVPWGECNSKIALAQPLWATPRSEGGAAEPSSRVRALRSIGAFGVRQGLAQP